MLCGEVLFKTKRRNTPGRDKFLAESQHVSRRAVDAQPFDLRLDINVCVMWLTNQNQEDIAELILILLSTGLVIFGAAFWVSTCCRSAIISAGIGLCSPMLVGAVMGLVDYLGLEMFGNADASFYTVACCCLGVLCAFAGAAMYLRRIEP